MPELFDTKYFRGQGALFMGARSAAGEPDNLVFIGDLGEATMESDVARSEIIENTTGQGGVGSTSMTRVQYNLNIMMRSAKPPHLALALQGAVTEFSGGAVTGTVRTARHGKFVLLNHVKVSSLIVHAVGGTPGYVEGTDYILHADKGMVEIIAGGGIPDNSLIEIPYTYASQDHVTANPSNVDRYLVFAGKNTADNNKQTRCELYKVRLDPGALDLITSEEAEYPITGRVLMDSLRPVGDQFFKWKIED